MTAAPALRGGTWGISEAGNAPDLGSGYRRFESGIPHHRFNPILRMQNGSVRFGVTQRTLTHKPQTARPPGLKQGGENDRSNPPDRNIIKGRWRATMLNAYLAILPLPWGGIPRHPRVDFAPKVHHWHLIDWYTSGFRLCPSHGGSLKQP